MAWQRTSCIVRAVQQPIRQTTPMRPFLQTSAAPLSSVPTHIFSQLRIQSRGYSTEVEENAGGEVKGDNFPVDVAALEDASADPTTFTAAPEIEFESIVHLPARILPASPAYFSGSPKFIDNLLKLERMQAKYASLPTVSAAEAPRMAWFKHSQFREFVGEPVPVKRYKNLLNILQQLNRIQPGLRPDEVDKTLTKFLRPGNPYAKQPEPPTVDDKGRARGKGKRKESSCVVHLVEGEGEVVVNGKTLTEYFPRPHDRESATWALRCTSRLDKYNVWVNVRGGGMTGQAEATTLAVARALLVHEPALKPILRQAGVITVDARQVERKKAGHTKARKMPAWVKR